eukprot:m.62505 g.62505  ORF g.62505 m.62505 type:complete len:265 (+) comp7138_c0_seq2:124-918(+)
MTLPGYLAFLGKTIPSRQAGECTMEVIDCSKTKIFIGGLSYSTTSKGLSDHFSKFGPLYEAIVICERTTGKSKGYGFVTFHAAEDAQRALEILGSTPVIDGRKTNCNLASLGARNAATNTISIPHGEGGQARYVPTHHVGYPGGAPAGMPAQFVMPAGGMLVDSSGNYYQYPMAYVAPPYDGFMHAVPHAAGYTLPVYPTADAQFAGPTFQPTLVYPQMQPASFSYGRYPSSHSARSAGEREPSTPSTTSTSSGPHIEGSPVTA